MRIIRSKTEDFDDYIDFNDMDDALKLMGFAPIELNFYRRVDPEQDLAMYGEVFDDGIVLDVYEKNQRVASKTVTNPHDLISFVESELKSRNIENIKIVQADELDMVDNGISPRSVMAARFSPKNSNRQKMSTRDFMDRLLRVKSSNVWAYAFNPKDEYTGDMLMQFKGTNGGPGDVYIYYDVPSKIWRRLVAAPSKGAAFWKLIRNQYTYAKLTGDKRTKLPNGI